MTQVYRLVRAERAGDALSGEGARRYGGRWNPPGVPAVYASESRALAVLETFVHLTIEARSMRFALFTITLPRRARVQRLPERPPSRSLRSSQAIGRDWIEDGTSLALVVPSVIVPQETNCILNVSHPQFSRLEVSLAEPFSFDERLWRRQLS